jgi:uncharacterized membrane protein YjfL (UPF0719 family)
MDLRFLATSFHPIASALQTNISSVARLLQWSVVAVLMQLAAVGLSRKEQPNEKARVHSSRWREVSFATSALACLHE